MDDYRNDALEMVSQACFDYKTALFGMMNPDEEKSIIFRKAAAEYKKALITAIKYLQAEQKTVKRQLNGGDLFERED